MGQMVNVVRVFNVCLFQHTASVHAHAHSNRALPQDPQGVELTSRTGRNPQVRVWKTVQLFGAAPQRFVLLSARSSCLRMCVAKVFVPQVLLLPLLPAYLVCISIVPSSVLFPLPQPGMQQAGRACNAAVRQVARGQTLFKHRHGTIDRVPAADGRPVLPLCRYALLLQFLPDIW